MAAGKPGPVIPERYVTALAGRAPIDAMAGAPGRIAKAIRGLDERELARRPAPGKWSIKEVIAHLADGEVIVGSRVRMVAAMERPQLVGYDQDAFVDRLGVDQVDTKHLLAAFDAARALNVALYKRLPKTAFGRVGLHTERGEESVAAMLAMYAGHDVIHEQQIAQMREALAARRKRKATAKR